MSKILFFTASGIATADELAEIARLNALAEPAFREVGVRNAEKISIFTPNPESVDLVAGAIPTDYNAVTDYGEIDAARPLKMDIFPAAATIAPVGTAQLQVVKVTGDDLLDLTITDVTDINTTYASDNESFATVDAAGEVTGVADGVATITATHTYASGKTELATSVITVVT